MVTRGRSIDAHKVVLAVPLTVPRGLAIDCSLPSGSSRHLPTLRSVRPPSRTFRRQSPAPISAVMSAQIATGAGRVTDADGRVIPVPTALRDHRRRWPASRLKKAPPPGLSFPGAAPTRAGALVRVLTTWDDDTRVGAPTGLRASPRWIRASSSLGRRSALCRRVRGGTLQRPDGRRTSKRAAGRRGNRPRLTASAPGRRSWREPRARSGRAPKGPLGS